MATDPTILDKIAAQLLDTFGTDRVLERLTNLYPGFDLSDGYAIAHRMRLLREARGEKVMGRKIGGTNPATYAQTGAQGPSWNFMFNTTVTLVPDGCAVTSIGNFRQSCIEPEIVLHISRDPEPGLSENEIIEFVDKVAFGYELVHSPFSAWNVSPADAVAAFGLHQAMFVGPWCEIAADRKYWIEALKSVRITMISNTSPELHGTGANVLGSPLNTLRVIVDDIAIHRARAPVVAGEIITTGTLTRLMPVEPGQTWITTISEAPLTGLTLAIV